MRTWSRCAVAGAVSCVGLAVAWSALAWLSGDGRAPERGGAWALGPDRVHGDACAAQHGALERIGAALSALREEQQRLLAAVGELRAELSRLGRVPGPAPGEAPAGPGEGREGPAAGEDQEAKERVEARIVAEAVARHRAALLQEILAAEAALSDLPEFPPDVVVVTDEDVEGGAVALNGESGPPVAVVPSARSAALRAEGSRTKLAELEAVRTLEELARWRHAFGVLAGQ